MSCILCQQTLRSSESGKCCRQKEEEVAAWLPDRNPDSAAASRRIGHLVSDEPQK